MSRALRAVRYGPGHPRFAGYTGLGSLGITASAGAQTAGAVVGQVAIPIPGLGAAIGGLVGGIVGGLFGHEDHAKVNADVNARQNLFGQYTTMAGTVPGRQIGLATMREVWKGAAHEGHFPKWQGQEQRIDYAIDGCNKCDPNTFNVLWPKAQTAGVRDAKTFIDQYFIPANASAGDHWAVPQDAVGYQILYDTADAYLSQKAPASLPYVSTPPSPTPAPIPPTPVTAMPVPTPTGQPLPVVGQGVTSQSLANSGYIVIGVDPLNGLQVWQQPGARPVELSNGQLLPYYPPTPAPQSSPVPVVIPTPAPQQSVLPSGATVPAAGIDPNTQAYINQLLAQGASQQQAFSAALQQLQQQGVQPTPQVQQQVAAALPAAPVTSGLSGQWPMIIAGGLALLSILFATARPVGPAPRRRA